jgi:FlaA1/EpsC-like NDP-sugar epimerase
MNILITGGTGYLGSHLVKHLLENKDVKIRIFSKDWKRQFKLKNEICNDNVEFILGDICRNTLDRAMESMDYVIHTAAIKEINFCEENPLEALQVNTLGSQHVIECAKKNKVQNCILISTDKAFEPINTYGMTKALAEKLFLEAGYTVIRYGNVFGSSGSVINVWNDLVNKEKEIQITDLDATRFILLINDAIKLILDNINKKGLIIPKKLHAFTMRDLLKAFEIFSNTKIKYATIGLRSYEKKHESLEEGASSELAGKICVKKLIYLMSQDFGESNE